MPENATKDNGPSVNWCEAERAWRRAERLALLALVLAVAILVLRTVEAVYAR
jgi:hypothetical protein